jgi:two-component system cell cycle response regulator
MPPVASPESRVLSIDDSVLIHRLLKAHLRHERVELHCALNGADGLRMAKALNPDAVLLDVDMPDLDGFAVLSALKAEAVTQHIPVILVSGSCTTDDRVRGLDLGAVDFVVKPFEIAELKARVRSALRTTRLIKLLAQRAQIDGLTGLWNRTYFDERLAQELASAERHGDNVALVLCDIDHFKAVNDKFGHPVGDLVLEEFARVLSGSRITDITCRYGGEEFGMIIPRADAAQGAIAAERLRAAVERFEWPDRPSLRVTASFGVADRVVAGSFVPSEVVAAADRALYLAKQTGRNRVCRDGELVTTSLRTAG